MCEKKFQTNKKKTIFRRLTAVLSIGRNTQKNRLHKKKTKNKHPFDFFLHYCNKNNNIYHLFQVLNKNFS